MDEMKQDNICEKCGTENHCPCACCKANKFTKKRDIVWIWDKSGNIAFCGKCYGVLFT